MRARPTIGSEIALAEVEIEDLRRVADEEETTAKIDAETAKETRNPIDIFRANVAAMSALFHVGKLREAEARLAALKAET